MDEAHLRAVSEALYRMGGLIPSLGIALDSDGGVLRCRMRVEQRHTGAPGVAHGGAVMTLMDTALGAHALAHAVAIGKATSTVEMKVNFLRPAREGHVLVTDTTVQSAGQSLLVISGHAVDEATEERVAFAVGTFNLYATGDFAEQLQAFLAQARGA